MPNMPSAPCPICLWHDKTLYGEAFILDGRVIDPLDMEASWAGKQS